MVHRRDGLEDRPHIWDFILDWLYALWITFRPGSADEGPEAVPGTDESPVRK